ncbi:non-specific lipid-transfer protein 1-like protein [Carex littledalei]|uniref:Non-specific lipid-transfer protein 1-like protein n=1 Tax=Carex littledalei TaxID=544730 RepID=A0A833R6Q9_9POAL|nr:non-specific lipid-transfer protein 1-like protein [Carex littledalei]
MTLSSSFPFTITLVALLFLSLPYRHVKAIDCGDVVNFITPCISYIDGGTVSHSCCYGVKKLYKTSYSSEYDLKEVCTCLKQEALLYSGLTADVVEAVTTKCGVKLPFRFSIDVDCSA